MSSANDPQAGPPAASGWLDRALNSIERIGNKLPDPAMLFVILLAATWVVSWALSGVEFSEIDPRSKTGEAIAVQNMLSGPALADFMARMVKIFTGFHPLGVVLVALLGVGVAEHTGYINAGLKLALSITPRALLTPMLIFVAILSHTAADAGYVLVIPLGGAIFYAAGRHPLVGIAAAFAGVSGGFSANPVVSGIDPLLQGITQAGAQVLDPEVQVNPLCNWLFTALSSVLIIGVGWFVTERIVARRVEGVPIDGDPDEMPKMEEVSKRDLRGFLAGTFSIVAILAVMVLWAAPADSALRDPASGKLLDFGAPLMQSIVPWIFLLFLAPGVVHGYVAGTVKGHRDIVEGMSKAMGTMGYYLVMAFFASLFIDAFGKSNLGALLALKGGTFLRESNLPDSITVVGIILLTGFVNLFVGSASAKWALLAPIFVPMLMAVGLSPELTQASYRVGDSTTNIITPLMPYFPLVVVFCQRYVKGTGIGTLISLMLPYSVAFLVTWSAFLLLYWTLGIPLGIQASYAYP